MVRRRFRRARWPGEAGQGDEGQDPGEGLEQVHEPLDLFEVFRLEEHELLGAGRMNDVSRWRRIVGAEVAGTST